MVRQKKRDQNSCQYTVALLTRLRELDTRNELDYNQIEKAISWAKQYHAGQFRKDGEPFYSHPLRVAYMISEHYLKSDVVIACILHDIVEDTEVTIDMIVDNFGHRIAEMVDRLTRDRPGGAKLSVTEIIKNAHKHGDKEVLLIKIFDRLHNLQNMEYITTDKQIATARESLNTVLLATTYLEDVNLEFAIGSIINKILDYKAGDGLLKYKSKNSLLDRVHRNHFTDLFKS